MSRYFAALACAAVMLFVAQLPAFPQETAAANAPGHYMFAWTGDEDHKGMDFLAVIDADLELPAYGKLITTLVTDQPTILDNVGSSTTFAILP